MGQLRFAAAREGERIVYGAERPGYSDQAVGGWIKFMQDNSIHRVCCLLSPEQLTSYPFDLLEKYREAFGESNVCHAPIEDLHLCDTGTLENVILPFLLQSDQANNPVVVHCWGGSGRTGHVLAAWLVRHRDLSVDAALGAVRSTGRNPREAVECGNATEQDLRGLLTGPQRRRSSPSPKGRDTEV